MVRRRRLRYGLVTTFLLLPLCGQSAAALADDAVTMRVGFHRNTNDALVFRFSGTAGAAGGASVDVMARGCGVRGFRLIAGTRTRAGGGWRVEYPPEEIRPWRYPPIQSGATLRARWKGQLSAPYAYRSEAPLVVSAVPGRLARAVHVSPPPPGTVSMTGKVVLLQRLRGRSWVTIRRAPLEYKPSYEHGALNHEVVFPVARYSTLRAVLPRKSAAPCYLATITEPFRIW